MATRSMLLTMLLTGTVALAGCAGPPAPAEPPPAATQAVEHAAGTTDVPTDVERLVVTDEYAALLAMALGAPPAFAFNGQRSASLGGVVASAGVPTADFDVKAPDFEAIAAQQPDLVVTTATVDPMQFYDRYSAIAPTVVVPYTADWRAQTRIAATALGQTRQADALIADLDSRIAALADRLAGTEAAGTSVSVIGAFGGQLYAVPETTLIAQVLAELGLARPEAQNTVGPESAGGYLYFSDETLTEHDADLVLVQGGGAGYDPTAIMDSPLARRFTGSVVEVDGEQWNGNTPFAVHWILADVEAVLLGDDAVGTGEDAQPRWQQFVA